MNALATQRVDNRDHHHSCGLCGQPIQTYHNGACRDCKRRVNHQVSRYANLAGYVILEMNLLFDVYQTNPAKESAHE